MTCIDTSLDDFVSGGGDGSSGSEADDDAIGNTMLITGAHGIGKTAMVYALAAQLGYKVGQGSRGVKSRSEVEGRAEQTCR